MTPAQMIEVLQAYERGEKIEAKHKIKDARWDILNIEPSWNFLEIDYRIAKPAPKKVYAYIGKTSGHVRMVLKEGSLEPMEFYRAPWLDGEIEE